jgi:N-acetylmuramoyl-L-alanine amidase
MEAVAPIAIASRVSVTRPTCDSARSRRISAFMHAGKLATLASLLLAVHARAVDWNVIPHQGRDYVSFANVAEFYQFDEYSHAVRTVSLRSERRSIRAQADSSEMYINGVRFFTNLPIVTHGNDHLISALDVGKIIEPVLRPSRINGAQKIETVVLDPGHGGRDQGATNRWGTEKGFALDVAIAAREQLLRAGFKVEITRTTDVGLSLDERAEFANRFPNSVFVSIHFNAASGGSGVESYTLAPEGVPSNATPGENHPSEMDTQRFPGNDQDNQNIALSAAVHAAVLSRVAPFDRGVRHARFKVLRNIKVPALLLEGGFLSDPVEGQRIATSAYRQQLGAAIAQGVQAFNTAVNYRSPNGGGTFAVVRANLPPHAHSITEPLAAQHAASALPPQPPSVSISGGE